MKQRTTEWRMARLGDVTASRFKDVLTQPRTKAAREAGEMSETAKRYMRELLTELITGIPLDRWQTPAMKWGTEWEAEAFTQAYEAIAQRFGAKPSLPEGEFAYIQHPTEEGIGCSPDGIIGDDGLLEIKCPANPSIHLDNVFKGIGFSIDDAAARLNVSKLANDLVAADGNITDTHKDQVQGSLWITGRKFYYFCSFDPRFANSAMGSLLVVYVERDDEYIDKVLAPAVLEFRNTLKRIYKELVNEPF